MKVKQAVTEVLTDSVRARNNDNECIYLTLKKLGLPTDYRQLLELNSSIAESITRARRLVQANNPFLAPTNRTASGRRIKEEKIKEEIRNDL